MRGQNFQIALIALILLCAALYSAFLYREIFPEYKVYQDRYVALEAFRSEVSGQRQAPFRYGIKQVVLAPDDGGPETIDRCTSCHLAMNLEHFSPTRLKSDANGNLELSPEGLPVQEPNPDYVWNWLDARIERLKEEGNLAKAEELESWKWTESGELRLDMTKALAMHPLIGKERRPFEFHPVEEYGCTVCHGGNGRALTFQRAHGPVYDGQYEPAHEGPKPQFLENDPENDPLFSRVFNHRPGHKLLFQTTPVLVGGTIEASCVQCHLTQESKLESALASVQQLKESVASRTEQLRLSYEREKGAIASLLRLQAQVETIGYAATLEELQKRAENLLLPQSERERSRGQMEYLQGAAAQDLTRDEAALLRIGSDLERAVGNPQLIEKLPRQATPDEIESFVRSYQNQAPRGATLFDKARSLTRESEVGLQLPSWKPSLPVELWKGERKDGSVESLTRTYSLGRQLFLSQGCYACHKIAGLARGGIGPELTYEGEVYPWFIKESIVWPQADLPTSTMPNFKLDHEELEALTTFLLAQKGRPTSMSEVEYQIAIRNWEQGQKREWEEEVTPDRIRDVRYGMTIFAAQGCASCHRLKGYSSDVGFAVEKEETPDFATRWEESQWFQRLFPEEQLGSDIVATVEKHAQEIDRRIVDGVREGSILEEIEASYPGTLESFYSPYKFALRAKDAYYSQLIADAVDDSAKQSAQQQWQQWRDRIRRILLTYIQEYGLGRLIGPRPNWSGIYRSDQWLMEHFYNPSQHVARSIMPALPFDSTKFYALTYMLDELGRQNSASVREIWSERGFSPELAYEIHCAQCHGTYRQGGGPVAEWIYPIPKNLRNATILRNLTPERAVQSIVHGVKGGPMAPWGETPDDKPFVNDTPVMSEGEIRQLVDWIYQALPGEELFPEGVEPQRWDYTPEDVLKDLENEGKEFKEPSPQQSDESMLLAALFPVNTLVATAEPEKPSDIEKVFAIQPHPVPLEKRPAYYIKREYYTRENLKQGEALFIENCAACHGNEGAGNGLRAGSMVEAKPRMLTNLDWLSTRDDLRLLRSIKYGVTGTSMLAWGDATSAWQRMQMVMYIRSLSRENALRDHLSNRMYRTFDAAIEQLRTWRAPLFSALVKTQEKLQEAKEKSQQLATAALSARSDLETATEVYKKELALAAEEQKREAIDKEIAQLIERVEQERALFDALASALVVRVQNDPVLEECLLSVEPNPPRFAVEKERLSLRLPEASEGLGQGLHCVQQTLITRMEALDSLRKQQQARLPSNEREQKLEELSEKLTSYRKLTQQIIETEVAAEQLRDAQKQLVDSLNQQLRVLKQQEGSDA